MIHIREAQHSGIWAWDIVLQEAVLVIPSVLALLGDNPMQSEFACHIGLRGKFFCRACWVKGSDALQETPTTEIHTRDEDGQSEGSDSETSTVASAAGSEVDTDESAGGDGKSSKKGKHKGKKIKETLGQVVERVKAFMKVWWIYLQCEHILTTFHFE